MNWCDPGRWAGVLLALCLHATSASGQTAELAPGDFVRLTLTPPAPSPTHGTVERVGPGGVVLGPTSGSRAFSIESIQLAEVRTRPDRRVQTGLFGAVAGAGVGFLIVRAALDAAYLRDADNGLYAAVLGVPAGAVTGGVIGVRFGRERWEEAYVFSGPERGLP